MKRRIDISSFLSLVLLPAILGSPAFAADGSIAKSLVDASAKSSPGAAAKSSAGVIAKLPVSAVVKPSVREVAKSFAGAIAADPRDASEPGVSALLPGMHGEGRGIWRGTEQGLGRLRATTRVSPEGPTFAIDAALARVVPMGPHGDWIEGTLFGEMLALDPVLGRQVVATIVGQWVEEPDGRGAFVAHLFVPTGDPDEPVVFAGRCVGTFRTQAAASGSSSRGVASLRWSVDG